MSRSWVKATTPLVLVAIANCSGSPAVRPTGRAGATGSAAPSAEGDALERRVLTELSVFTAWLHRYGVQGDIGEVGWPDGSSGDAPRWNALAERWFERADAAGLWVTVWAAGEWWGTGYPLAAYEDRTPPPGVDTPDTQAAVIERHPSTSRYLRGINVAGGEFGAPATDATSAFSNADPGVYGRDYHYDGEATFDFLASRGIRLVRIPFRWERLQPAVGGPLEQAELSRLVSVVRRAEHAGLEVVLDMHNFGAYYLAQGSRGVRTPIGSAGCSDADFGDAWRRISAAFGEDPGVVGYGLMNEPVGLSPQGGLSPQQVWDRASQAAVDAIRAGGDRRVILVSGYEWSGAQEWDRWNPRPWIHDPAGRIRYEAHHYWDPDHSGTYAQGYDAAVADAAARGF